MSPKRTTPNPQELLNANTFWIKLVSKSKEIAEAKMQNKKTDVDTILGECGVSAADLAYYRDVIMKCPVTNPW